jgi:hypothetical protein
VLTDNERAMVENYLSEKWGVGSYSSPNSIGSSIVRHKIKVSNKEAQNWVDRVFANGGSVSQKTADSVNEFCKKIESAGIRKKFYRLNLFCGNDLTACLTPLYLGPDSNTFYGFRTESNTGFFQNNYDEKNGLIAGPGSVTGGNGIFLLTGLTLSGAGLSDTGHMAFYQNQFNIDTNPYNAGNRPAIGAGNSYITIQGSNNVLAYYGGFSGVTCPYYGGLFIISRDSLSSLRAYEQGVLLTENTTTISIPDQSSQVGVFTSTNGSAATGNNYYFAYMKGYSVGQSMTQQEVSQYNSIMESFQTSLGRGLSVRASAQFTSVNNEEAKSWIDAVYANNGTVSASTALAVNNFCNSIDAAGLRNKFYRLNLFCGNNLNSCLVPLYRGPARLGVRHGSQRDVNVSQDGYGYYANSDNFNYIENQGLLGNTQEIAGNSSVSRRFLNTGFITGDVAQLNNNMHYSIYSRNLTNGGYPIGALDASNIGLSLQIGLGGYNWGTWANSLLNTTNTSTTRIFPSRKGLYVGNYNNNILTLYEGRASAIGQRDLTSIYAITPTSLSPVGIFAENRLLAGVALFNYLDRLQSYSIGAALTSTDVQNYYDIMQTFQTALSRAQQTTLSSTFDTITNVDARDWLSRVYENGGTVSLTTASAVQNFCNTIDSAGLRGKFFRLNLFCGDNLSAATIPLYRGPSIGGTQHGFLIDINNNFISADYNESGSLAGIKGNGSNKRLDTGLGTDFTNNSSISFGAFISEPTSIAFSAYLGVHQNTDADATVLYYRDGFTRGLDGVTFYPAEPTNSTIFGYHVYSRTASNNYFHSWNGVAGASSTAASAARGPDTFMIHAQNNNGTAAYHSNGRVSMYHIGLGLTSAEATTLYNAINTFNTAMNRTRPSDSFASVTNHDAKIWVDNVYYNGGSVSADTANAVNTFANTVDSVGIRNKIYRLNLMCGNNLAAALVPLYKGPNANTLLGNFYDLNNGSFSYDDSSPSLSSKGIRTGGAGSRLDTGLKTTMLPSLQTAHFAVAAQYSSGGPGNPDIGWNFPGTFKLGVGIFSEVDFSVCHSTNTINIPSFRSSFPTRAIASRTSSGIIIKVKGINNNYTLAPETISGTITSSFTIFGFGINSTEISSGGAGSISFYSVGSSLTQTEIDNFDNALRIFLESIGRLNPV